MSHAADEDDYLEQLVNAMFDTSLAMPVRTQSMIHPYAHMYEDAVIHSDASTDEEYESRDEVSSNTESAKIQDPELERYIEMMEEQQSKREEDAILLQKQLREDITTNEQEYTDEVANNAAHKARKEVYDKLHEV